MLKDADLLGGLARKRRPCRPCDLDGCGGGKTSDCLATLPVEVVMQAVQHVLGQAR